MGPASVTSPMFPLGSVLLPGALLPLRIFEPRYRVLAQDVVGPDGEGSFGVCLIERGSEVGGGEVRTNVGVRAEVVRADELPDGQWSIIVRGTERIRVDSWLSDDPYPRAMVSAWPDPPASDAERRAVAGTRDLLQAIVDAVERLGQPVDAVRLELDHLDPDAEPGIALWQVVSSSPLGPADRQRLLECPDVADRVALASELLDEQRQTLAALADDADG